MMHLAYKTEQNSHNNGLHSVVVVNALVYWQCGVSTSASDCLERLVSEMTYLCQAGRGGHFEKTDATPTNLHIPLVSTPKFI